MGTTKVHYLYVNGKRETTIWLNKEGIYRETNEENGKGDITVKRTVAFFSSGIESLWQKGPIKYSPKQTAACTMCTGFVSARDPMVKIWFSV